MHQHRKQADGKLRDSDNWQKGIPISAYKKSLIRHTMDIWSVWRGFMPLSVKKEYPNDSVRKIIINLLCAIIFNAMGYLYELLRYENEE